MPIPPGPDSTPLPDEDPSGDDLPAAEAANLPADITRLLQRHREGDRAAFDRVMPLVYQQLRAIARRQLARGGPRGLMLDTTSLVQEAYLELVGENGVDWQNRGHFFAICARAMRRIMVDDARRRLAAKRGGGAVEVTLMPDMAVDESEPERLLAIDDALSKLAAFNARLAQVVECRYFAGMTEEETAEALDSSLRTVQRDWMRARAWLLKALDAP